ncbi:hypothetical protein KUTeg_011978 [Tegillarca granosa]|uniref:Metalloendopeptidase n=1 Tax=Tegillarca granosa TaxID=220873 RepID=A0ABQ9EY83_TEGGR|nr:hypothetical protein KUTeg_011978 [Tegillarca granosa]
MERRTSNSEIFMIKVAMREWEKYTCLTFHEATETTRNYILFQDGFGCNSQLGEVGNGPQVLNLDKNGCRWKGLYLHEIGHAIGLVHEHQLPIRDNYIDILYQNVQPQMRIWFNKYPERQINQFDVDYEYSSVMHYGVTAFAADGKSQTIRTKDPSREKEIGRVYQKELSFTDVEIVSKMYSCSSPQICPNVRCINGGFVDQNCDCICPDGSNDCREGVRYDTSCRNSGSNLDSWKCYIWARQGECVRNKNFMEQNCRKACGLCGTENEPRSNFCEDHYDTAKCEKWKANSDCIIAEEFMKKNCRQTCGFCDSSSLNKPPPGTNCANTYQDSAKCEEWARKGECAANPLWMPQNCQKACRTCEGGNTGGSLTTRPTEAPRTTSRPLTDIPRTTARPQTVQPVTTTSPRTTTEVADMDCTNTVSETWCIRLQSQGECDRIPSWMETRCKKACGFCNKAADECKDRYDVNTCRAWANAGYCTRTEVSVFMEANCRKTCGKCAESCVNTYKDERMCKIWADYNQCVVNPGFMKTQCAKACRSCTEGLKVASNDNRSGSQFQNDQAGNHGERTSPSTVKLTLLLLIFSVIMKHIVQF